MSAHTRLASLDILRGLTVIGMIAVNSSYGLQRMPVPAMLHHADWIGLTFADLVFPAFIFMVGVSVAVSKAATGLDATAMRGIVMRGLRLIALGFILSNALLLADYDLRPVRVFGVLQRIGLVFLVIAPLHLRWSTRAICTFAVALLLGYSALCFLPMPGGTADLQVAGANFVAWVDRAVLGTHMYVRGPLGYDPEGLLSTLPAIAQGCLGVIAGRSIATPGSGRRFVVWGIALAALGGALAFVVPVSKELWSASFVLVTSAITLAALGVLHATVDIRGWKLPLAGLATAFGVNAIAAYVLHYLADDLLAWQVMDTAYAIGSRIVGASTGVIFPIALFVAGIGWVMFALRRRGWFIKL